MFVHAIKRGHGCVRVSSPTKSPVYSYVCVCVLEAPPEICVCVSEHGRPRTRWVVYERVSVIITPHQQRLVCVCMYMHANTAEGLRLHKAVILLLIMKQFVLKIVPCSITTAPCNLLSSPHKENYSQDTLTNCVLSSKG